MTSDSSSLTELWNQFTDWLRDTVPSQYKLLNGPATNEDFATFKSVIGYDFPDNLRSIYAINNGGRNEGVTIWDQAFLPIDQIIDNRNVNRDAIEYERGIRRSSYPENAIKAGNYNMKWVPFTHDGSGNHIGIDLDPGPSGTVGQVIEFGRDINNQVVIAPSLEKFIELTLLQIEHDNVEITTELDNSQEWSIKDFDYALYGVHLDLVEYGKQTTKIFFIPHIEVVTDNSRRELTADWVGRVLPGQTLFEGAVTELQEVYGYTGRLEVGKASFLDITKDNKGNDIQRYDIAIKLLPTESDKLPE